MENEKREEKELGLQLNKKTLAAITILLVVILALLAASLRMTASAAST